MPTEPATPEQVAALAAEADLLAYLDELLGLKLTAYLFHCAEKGDPKAYEQAKPFAEWLRAELKEDLHTPRGRDGKSFAQWQQERQALADQQAAEIERLKALPLLDTSKAQLVPMPYVNASPA